MTPELKAFGEAAEIFLQNNKVIVGIVLILGIPVFALVKASVSELFVSPEQREKIGKDPVRYDRQSFL